MLLPVVPKLVDFQASFLYGKGNGRYGASGLYDAVVNPITGKLDPIQETQILLGLVGHPTNRLDVYVYAGVERESNKDIYNAGGVHGGFGNPVYAPPGLEFEGNSASSTYVQASAVQQIAVGAWYSFYKGKMGVMSVGLTDAYTRLDIFGLRNETLNTIMSCFRYYPF